MTLDQEAANFLQRKAKCEVVLRGNHAAHFLFLFFVRLLAAPLVKHDSESAPLFFCLFGGAFPDSWKEAKKGDV